MDRDYPQLTHFTNRFTMSTGALLTRALRRLLRGHTYQSEESLHQAVGDACRELRAEGLEDHAVLAFLGSLVADAGRAFGADRPSLMSGVMRWVPVRTRVLDLATVILARDAQDTPVSEMASSSVGRAGW